MGHNANVTQSNGAHGYVQLSPLKVKTLVNPQGAPTVTAGFNAENKYVRFNAEAGIGPNIFDAHLEVGGKIPLKENLTLKPAIVADYTRQTGDKNQAILTSSIEVNGQREENVLIESWHDEAIKLGIATDLEYTKGKWKLTGGIEAGIRGATEVDLYSEVNYIDPEGNEHQAATSYNNGGKSGYYITPRMATEYGLGKGFSINAKANIHEGNIGIRYTF